MRLAEEIAMLDILSNGRIISGFSQIGMMFPNSKILACFVLRARMAPMRFMVAFMHDGVL